MDNIEQYIYSNRFSHVYLYNAIDNESIKEVREAIDAANKSENLDDVMTAPKGIILHINSPGGAITAGIGLMRIVARSRVPIIVYIEGISASAATFISVLAKYRVIAPHATILLHQYFTSNAGQRDEVEFDRKVVEKMYSMMKSLYLKNTRIPVNYLDELLEHDLFLTPELALQFGLVDKILTPQNSINVEKYFKLNPEYDLNKLMVDKKTNFNNIYLYGESGWMDNSFSKSLNLAKQLVKIIQKHPIYRMSSKASNHINNLNSIISKGGSKPIVIHISDLGEFNNIYQILPIVNILAICPVPTICIIDGPMNAICMLIAIMCNKAYIYHYAFISMNFVNFGDSGMKIGDTLYNTKLFISIIQNLLRTYTKLPAEIINTILKKRYLFPAAKCVEYGIVDGILND
jgi:ATP-dependent Clp protease protease subunit